MRFAIDAGHGLYTSGKRAPDDSMREFHFNSAVSNELTRILKNEYRQNVINPYDVTGETDTPLWQRVRRANDARADVYISIHANAYGSTWNDANGIETFVYEGGSQTKSLALAANVQTHLIRETGLRNRGVKKANFQVLRDTNMPAILVEGGFMTNRQELARLKDARFRKTVARAISLGIAATYNLKAVIPAPAPAPAPTPTKGGDTMADYYNPQNQWIQASTHNVLEIFEKMPNMPIDPTHREALRNGTLTNSQAIGLLYVAIERGFIPLAR